MAIQSNGGAQNLRPWRPGQSGNPGGRPKTKLFKEALEAELEAAGDDGPSLRKIARALLDKAATADIPAIKELADRLDGKPTQILEHNSADGAPTLRFVREVVHVTETRENLEKEDLVVEYNEVKAISGNGHDH
jgi:Family of unknown function (DUF5681)